MVCTYREHEMTDRSNGYEGIAPKFLAVRGGPGSSVQALIGSEHGLAGWHRDPLSSILVAAPAFRSSRS